MLEEPDISPALIAAHLQDAYAVQASELTFLPLGADVNTAVYRAVSADGSPYFVKLRGGAFDDVTVRLPKFLSAQGVRQVIAPLETKAGQLWAEMGAYKLILYPFIEGLDAYAVSLTDAQWLEFGEAIKAIHRSKLPSELLQRIPCETYDPRWREQVKAFQSQVEEASFDDPVASELAAFMRQKQTEISELLKRAERLVGELQSCQIDLVLCHSDLHAGNLHLTPDGRMFIVDWDNPLMAPKEHDLMHIGASARWHGRHVKSLFYRGYGDVQVDGRAIAYYRCERVIQDIAAFCAQLLSTTAGGKDREQSLGYFTRQFEPGQEVEIALKGGTETQRLFYACFKPRRRQTK